MVVLVSCDCLIKSGLIPAWTCVTIMVQQFLLICFCHYLIYGTVRWVIWCNNLLSGACTWSLVILLIRGARVVVQQYASTKMGWLLPAGMGSSLSILQVKTWMFEQNMYQTKWRSLCRLWLSTFVGFNFISVNFSSWLWTLGACWSYCSSTLLGSYWNCSFSYRLASPFS